MAFTSREIPVPAAEVFAALTKPETYPKWLIGASAIRGVDAS